MFLPCLDYRRAMPFFGSRDAQSRQRQLLELLQLLETDGRMGLFEYTYESDSGLWSLGQERLYGIELPPEGITWERWAALTLPVDYEREVRVFQAAVDARRDNVDIEYRIVRSDGEVRWLHSSILLFYASDGRPTRMLGFSQDITEKKEMEQRLAEAEQRKSEQIGMIATELARASRGIRQALEVAQRQGLLSEPLRATSANIERGLEFLERMTSDLRSTAEASRGALSVAIERFDFERTVDLALQNAMPYLQERDVRLSVCSWPSVLAVDGDCVRLAQTVSSLLITLAQHTAAGEYITLTVNAAGTDLLVSLSNTDAAAGPAGDRDFPAWALLSIGLARAVMRLHRGNVQMRKSANPQHYEFILRLPLAAVMETSSL